MASHAMGSCCYQGVKHEGEAVGEIKTIGDVEAYISYPKDKSTENAILIATDVVGHKFINVQLIADQLAANGYFVVIPDIFAGDPIPLNRPPGFDIQKWMKGEMPSQTRAHLPPNIDPVIASTLSAMREAPFSCRRIGGIGYCFGAKYVVRHMTSEAKSANTHIDVGYAAHPSFVQHDEMAAIKGPFAISAAETDGIFPAEKRHETEVILKEKVKLPYQINLYSGVEHGFAVRGDPKDPQGKFAKESAFLQAVQWFEEHLKE